jgi:hypothetical protein
LDKVVKEILDVLPATIIFLLLFHMIALTKAAVVEEFSITAISAVGATVAAFLVAKAILVVEALPIHRLFSQRPLVQLLLKTMLYGMVAMVFRFVEEFIPLASKHGGFLRAVEAMPGEISWSLFAVFFLWILCGLLLYSVILELARALGSDKVR